jgi:hypothetical protein
MKKTLRDLSPNDLNDIASSAFSAASAKALAYSAEYMKQSVIHSASSANEPDQKRPKRQRGSEKRA